MQAMCFMTDIKGAKTNEAGNDNASYRYQSVAQSHWQSYVNIREPEAHAATRDERDMYFHPPFLEQASGPRQPASDSAMQ